MVSVHYTDLARELGIDGEVSGNEYEARCPFHDDQNPSFSMNARSGYWICHAGCGQGDFSLLVMKVLGISHKAALEWAKDKNRGLPLASVMEETKEILNLFTKGVLAKFEKPDWMRAYENAHPHIMAQWFTARGFPWDTISHWGIRFDGLSVYIPVRYEGVMIGWVKRNPNLSPKPKYENSPGLERSKILFGEIYSAHSMIILVEGVLDAIWCWQAGISAYALLGTQISTDQIKILQQHKFGEVVIALDADSAGREATEKVIDRLVHNGYMLKQIKRVTWPEGKKDAQDCNVEELRQAIESREDIAQWYKTLIR